MATAPAPLGIVEGFYGVPWSWEARRSCLGFLAEHGYDFYIYAPKSDAALRRDWRNGLPEKTAERLATLAARCRQAGLAFGIGFSPFEIWRDYDPAARSALRRAVARLNSIGADILCVLFDDMPTDLPGLAEMQAAIVAEIAGAAAAGRFIFCPTFYSFDPRLAMTFAGDPAAYLSEIGRRLDRAIDVFWTGPDARSEAYPADHLREVGGLLGRAPFLWDNHLANDGPETSDRLFLDTPQRREGLLNGLTAGGAINPMNQPLLSRIPLHAIATGEGLAPSCRAVCGEEPGAEIAADAPLLWAQGRAEISPEQRDRLAVKYDAFLDSPVARELAAWLGGAWPWDPECLTG